VKGAEKTTKAEVFRIFFYWEKIGRSFVTSVGNLSVRIRVVGSVFRGDLRYFVRDVFGEQVYGDSFADLDGAKKHAEAEAVKSATRFSEFLAGCRVRRRSGRHLR
jgi:hypothetical protein